jgi:hypothetical protein
MAFSPEGSAAWTDILIRGLTICFWHHPVLEGRLHIASLHADTPRGLPPDIFMTEGRRSV